MKLWSTGWVDGDDDVVDMNAVADYFHHQTHNVVGVDLLLSQDRDKDYEPANFLQLHDCHMAMSLK